MIKCPDCENGYNERTLTSGGELIILKEWCETCKGTGHIKHEGEREGVAWERE